MRFDDAWAISLRPNLVVSASVETVPIAKSKSALEAVSTNLLVPPDKSIDATTALESPAMALMSFITSVSVAVSRNARS